MMTPSDSDQPRSDRELALWMLDQMRESAAFLAMLRAARRSGRRDILDTREDFDPHTKRLAALFDGDEDVIVGDAVEVRQRRLLAMEGDRPVAGRG